jgi:hypothetical protein
MSLVVKPDWVIFRSSKGGGSSSRNTSRFTGRNSGIPIFTTLRVFIGAIPV